MAATTLESDMKKLSLEPRLVLFDLNGVFFLKVDKHSVSCDDLVQGLRHDFVLRPGIKNFILELKARGYTVGIFSSTKFLTFRDVLTAIFGREHVFDVIADRTHTTLDPDYGIDPNVKDFATIKDLNRIWNGPLFNEKRIWNPQNTLLVDHELAKIRFNPEANILIIPEYTLADYHDKVNKPLGLRTEFPVEGGLQAKTVETKVEGAPRSNLVLRSETAEIKIEGTTRCNLVLLSEMVEIKIEDSFQTIIQAIEAKFEALKSR